MPFMRDLFGIVGFFDLSERGSALGFFLIPSLRVRDRNHARPYGMSLILELVESPRDTFAGCFTFDGYSESALFNNMSFERSEFPAQREILVFDGYWYFSALIYGYPLRNERMQCDSMTCIA